MACYSLLCAKTSEKCPFVTLNYVCIPSQRMDGFVKETIPSWHLTEWFASFEDIYYTLLIHIQALMVQADFHPGWRMLVSQ